MYLPIKGKQQKGTYMSLVKFNTTSEIDLELESIKLSRPDCNTNAAAAKYAIENYLPQCESYNELKSLYDALLQEHDQLIRQLRIKQSAESQIEKLISKP